MSGPLEILVIFLTLPLLYSCQTDLQAQENPLEKKVAYTQVVHTKHHTKHIRKQQQKIHDRLHRIRERMEKRKRRRQEGGK